MNKEQISKILVKWGMPTRQVAINEIVALFAAYRSELVGKVEGMKRNYEKPAPELGKRSNRRDRKITEAKVFHYNAALNDVVAIITKEGK